MGLVELAMVGLGVAFALGLVRVVIGPSPADRAVATDVCLYAIVGLIALTVLRTGATEFVDVVLIATLLGFLAAIALGALIARNDR